MPKGDATDVFIYRAYDVDGDYTFTWTFADNGLTITLPAIFEDIRPGAVQDRYYTICLPKNVIAFQGGIFWNMSKRNASMAFIEEASLEELTAGTPFIFEVTGEKLEVKYEGAAAAAAGTKGALHGTLEAMDQAALNTAAATLGDIYLLSNNVLYNVTTSGAEGNSLAAGRAYVAYDELVYDTPSSVPGKRVRGVPMNTNVATDIEEVTGYGLQVMGAQKVIVNGQLYILRGEKMYDLTGKAVR